MASFARFSLRLMALGAPAALVSDAQQAMGDEIRHAERCFALASRYAGTPLRPGPLPMAGALTGGGDLCAVSVEVLREGAIGESIGALLADRGVICDPELSTEEIHTSLEKWALRADAGEIYACLIDLPLRSPFAPAEFDPSRFPAVVSVIGAPDEDIEL